MHAAPYLSSVKEPTHAVLIGGGIAGALAAYVLANCYERVTLIERDHSFDTPRPRSGAPQTFHIHRLLPRGRLILDQLLPGIEDELCAHGARSVSDGLVGKYITPYGTTNLVFPGRQVSFSRPLLEWVLHRYLETRPEVHICSGHEVISLNATPDKRRITGVQIRERGHLEQTTTLDADLVIDASGRSSHIFQWLTNLGYKTPEEEYITTDIGYASRHYAKSAHYTENWLSLIANIDAFAVENTYAGMIATTENDIWEVMLGGLGGYYPPTSEEDFEQAFRRFPDPILSHTLQQAIPVTPLRGFRIPRCTFSHFELLDNWPLGLLVMGDAFCNFDPIYGQGMTVAILEAAALANYLRIEGPQPYFERAIMKQFGEIIKPAWWLAAVADLQHPRVRHIGRQPLPGMAFAQAYFDLVRKRIVNDHSLFLKYMAMNGLLISPREFISSTLSNVLNEDVPLKNEQLQKLRQQVHAQKREDIATTVLEDIPWFEANVFAGSSPLR